VFVKIMKYTAIIYLAIANCAAVFGQQRPDQVKEAPRTQLEAFAAETGAVIIKGFSEVGKVAGMGGVEVDCREFTNASNGKKSFGIAIKVVESGRLERENSSFIDYDEISSLITGIDYISRIQPSVTNLTHFEATYTTKGDFAVTVFNNSSGKLSAAVSSGRFGRASAYLGMEKLVELRALIVKAKEKLDGLPK
jgi:hypothetical protein